MSKELIRLRVVKDIPDFRHLGYADDKAVLVFQREPGPGYQWQARNLENEVLDTDIYFSDLAERLGYSVQY